MRRNKIISKILLVTMVTSILVTSKAYGNTINARTNDLNKVWTIKFNENLKESTLKNEISVVDKDGNIIDSKVEIKEGKNVVIYPPKEGYINGNVYTLNIGKNIRNINSKSIKSKKAFIFEVNNESVSYNKSIYMYKDVVEKNIDDMCNGIVKNGINSDWQAIALAKNNKEIPSGYLDKIKKQIDNNEIVQSTDYERMILVLSALGQDPKNFNNTNLVEKLYNNPELHSQGNNALIFGLIALDSKNHQLENNSIWTREKLVDALLNSKTEDGGWSFLSSKAEPDMTGMAIAALSNYKKDEKINKSIEESITLLSSMQNTDGTFSSVGLKNSESISQVIIGLCANGIDPTSSEFTKSGKNLIDALLTFKSDDGGFKHIYEGNSNGKATEQALLALEAYKELKNGRLNLYEF